MMIGPMTAYICAISRQRCFNPVKYILLNFLFFSFCREGSRDEPVERLDEVETHVDGDEKGQHHPVDQVQPRDLASVGRQVRVRGPRRMLGGGGGGIFSSPCSPDRTGQRQESRRALVAASAWQLQRPARKGSNSSSARPAAGCCNRRDPDIPSYGEGDDAHGMRREYSQRTGVVEVNGLGHEPTSP